MKTKVTHNISEIVDVVNTWSGVRVIIVQQFVEKEIHDPNFSISLDVFCDGSIPDSDERPSCFPMQDIMNPPILERKTALFSMICPSAFLTKTAIVLKRFLMPWILINGF